MSDSKPPITAAQIETNESPGFGLQGIEVMGELASRRDYSAQRTPLKRSLDDYAAGLGRAYLTLWLAERKP